MLSFRAHVIICATLFALIIVLAIAGNALEAAGVVAQPESWKVPSLVLFSTLAVALSFSAVPVMVMLVLRFLRWSGNENVPFIKALIARQNVIIWVMWGLLGAGVAFGLLVLILGGVLGGGAGDNDGSRSRPSPANGPLSSKSRAAAKPA